jgi:hypothetical protein
MTDPTIDLRDLTDTQLRRLRREKDCKPVVNCCGQAIGVARSAHGAALVVVILANAACGHSATDADAFRAEEIPVRDLPDRFAV